MSHPTPIYLPGAAWHRHGPLGQHKVRRPAGLIIVHHTVTTPTDNPCDDFVGVEAIGRRRFGRGSYNYLIHPSGVIGELQGEHVGAHTAGRNSSAYGIALVGNYDTHKVPEAAIYSLCYMIYALRAFDLVIPRPMVLGHRQAPGAATACPGKHGMVEALPYAGAVASDPDWKPDQ